MLHVTVLQVVAILIAFLAQFSRIFAATKPFWSRLPAVVQVWLPPILPFAAALQAQLAGVASWTDLVVALIVSFALLLPGAPSNRSSAPLQAAKPFVPPPMAMLMICCMLGASLVLSGCGFLESRVPAAEQCAPTPAELASQVADILLTGGDYLAHLEQLALKDGDDAVKCATEAFLGNQKMGAGPEQAAAKGRARAYLKSKGVQ